MNAILNRKGVRRVENKDYIGKRALVGVSYMSADGSLEDKKQYHGTITGVDEQGWLILERANGQGELKIPAKLEPANPGEYTLASTGEVVVDPDFTAIWSVQSRPPPDDPREN